MWVCRILVFLHYGRARTWPRPTVTITSQPSPAIAACLILPHQSRGLKASRRQLDEQRAAQPYHGGLRSALCSRVTQSPLCPLWREACGDRERLSQPVLQGLGTGPRGECGYHDQIQRVCSGHRWRPGCAAQASLRGPRAPRRLSVHAVPQLHHQRLELPLPQCRRGGSGGELRNLHSAGCRSNIRVLIQRQGRGCLGGSMSMRRSVSFSQSTSSFLTLR